MIIFPIFGAVSFALLVFLYSYKIVQDKNAADKAVEAYTKLYLDSIDARLRSHYKNYLK